MKVVKVQVQQMLASSPGLTGTYTGGTVLGREDDFDFDDEE